MSIDIYNCDYTNTDYLDGQFHCSSCFKTGYQKNPGSYTIEGFDDQTQVYVHNVNSVVVSIIFYAIINNIKSCLNNMDLTNLKCDGKPCTAGTGLYGGCNTDPSLISKVNTIILNSNCQVDARIITSIQNDIDNMLNGILKDKDGCLTQALNNLVPAIVPPETSSNRFKLGGFRASITKFITVDNVKGLIDTWTSPNYQTVVVNGPSGNIKGTDIEKAKSAILTALLKSTYHVPSTDDTIPTPPSSSFSFWSWLITPGWGLATLIIFILAIVGIIVCIIFMFKYNPQVKTKGTSETS